MRSYEEISERIMQRGDEIIESRRNRKNKAHFILYFRRLCSFDSWHWNTSFLRFKKSLSSV